MAAIRGPLPVYVSTDSPLHRMHPLPKIILLLVINVTALAIRETIMALIIMIGIILIGYKIAKIPIRKLAKYLLGFFIITQSILVAYVLGSKIPGDVIWHTWPWGTYISNMTLLLGGSIALMFFTMVLSSTLIVSTMKDRDIILAFKTLRIPHGFIFIIALAMRTMGNFIDDFFRVRDAMLGKGAPLTEGFIVSRVRKHLHLMFPLAIISIRRMLELTNSVEARGFTIRGGKRTHYFAVPMKITSIVHLVTIFTALALILVMKYYLEYFKFPGWPFV